jgi:hypothetical protein
MKNTLEEVHTSKRFFLLFEVTRYPPFCALPSLSGEGPGMG